MAKVRFELHNKHKNGHYSIRASFRCEDGKIFRHDTKEYIHPRHWSKKSHRPIPSAPGAFKLITFLNGVEDRIQTAIRVIRLRGQRTTPALIKSEMRGESMELWQYWERFEEAPPEGISIGTLEIYQRLFKNLRLCCPNLTFADVSQATVDAYIKHRRTVRELKNGKVDPAKNDSTIRNELSKLRAFMGYAKKAGVIKVVPEIALSVEGVDPGEIYLTEVEILSIYRLIGTKQLNDHVNGKEITKYIRYFVLGTQIGVRVSDLSVQKDNVIERGGRKFLNLSNQKTLSHVIVPVSALAAEILDYLKWSVPEFEEVLLNRYIKIAGMLAGINEPCIWREKISGKVVETVLKKYELISSHTMRRSFATNLYLKGAPSVTIMKITGHKTESSFLKYIRISKQEAAEAIGEFF